MSSEGRIMKKYILMIFAVGMLFTYNVCAQTPTPTPTDVEFDLMQRAQMVFEIKRLRAESAAKDTIIAEQKSTIEVYKKMDGVQESRIADLKEAIKARTEAGGIDIKIEGMYKDRLLEFKTENERLRTENTGLRKSRDRRSLIFGIIGLAAGRFVF